MCLKLDLYDKYQSTTNGQINVLRLLENNPCMRFESKLKTNENSSFKICDISLFIRVKRLDLDNTKLREELLEKESIKIYTYAHYDNEPYWLKTCLLNMDIYKTLSQINHKREEIYELKVSTKTFFNNSRFDNVKGKVIVYGIKVTGKKQQPKHFALDILTSDNACEEDSDEIVSHFLPLQKGVYTTIHTSHEMLTIHNSNKLVTISNSPMKIKLIYR